MPSLTAVVVALAAEAAVLGAAALVEAEPVLARVLGLVGLALGLAVLVLMAAHPAAALAAAPMASIHSPPTGIQRGGADQP